MSDLRLARGLTLPIQLVTEPLAVLARRGWGKTYAAMVLAEEMLKAGQQIVALDPTDVWWGLRSKADGSGSGFPVVIFGGDHADVALRKEMGTEIADFLVDSDTSVILALSEFDESNQALVEFTAAFLKRLYARNRDPLHIFADEAEVIAPEQLPKYAYPMRGASNRIMKSGRRRGLGMTLIAQRTASVSKNVLSQAQGLMVGALSAPWDRAPLEKWVQTIGADETFQEMRDDLAKLQKGQGYFWHPEWDIFKKVQIREKKTFDSSATPEPGVKRKTVKSLAKVDLKRLRERMETAVQEAEENDPEKLKERVSALQAQVRELEQRPAEEKVEEIVKFEKVEVPIFQEEELGRLEEVGEHLKLVLTDEVQAAMKIAMTTIERGKNLIDSIEEKTVQAVDPPSYPEPTSEQVEHFQDHAVKMGATKVSSNGEGKKLVKAERSILTVLRQFSQGRTKKQIATLAGYAGTGGGFNNALGSLRSRGAISGDNKTIIRITDVGKTLLGNNWQPLPQGRALHDYWINRLPKAEGAILRVLIGVYPRTMTKEQIADKTEYASTGGGFNNALGKLRTLELIQGYGDIKASDDLF